MAKAKEDAVSYTIDDIEALRRQIKECEDKSEQHELIFTLAKMESQVLE